ncbi:MAG: DNA-binding protein [Anaerolineae bacterium]|nr:DNA-binding protein [Anaerolineae bacterium]
MRAHALRLHPGEDLKQKLDTFAEQSGMQAGCVLACAGSLSRARLRLADQNDGQMFNGPFEIVALSGTFSLDGSHLHIAISDGSGKTMGGHLMEGCAIYTTAEIVIGELDDMRFRRPLDPQTGYDELTIETITDED